MAIQIAQTKTGTSTLASTVIAWNNNTITGNTIVVAVATNITTDVSTITDSQSNTYVNACIAVGTGVGCELWYAKNIAGGATPTVTVNYTSGATAAVVIQEYSGIDSVTVLDKTSTSSGNSSSLSSGTTTQISQINELLIGVTGGISGTFTAGGNYVNLTQVANTTINVGIEDLFVTSSAAYSATFGASGSIQWACGVASFRASPQGTTTSTSSTSASTFSTSSTSISTSSTSTSISSTSKSTSTSSTSISTSTTSASTSSTSTSVSSTSSSSTSSSTSTSATTVSTSSTSTSSTSTSSTSISTSISSTSSSISSTSSSISSTSASTSSTSASTSSTSSSTSTTAIPLNLIYSYQDQWQSYKTPVLLQTKNASSTVSATSTNVAMNNTTTGSLVVVTINTDNSGVGVVSSISCAGMSFSKISDTLIATSGNNIEFWYAYNITGNTTPTLTINFSPNCISGAIIREYSNILATSDPLDQNRQTTNSGANARPFSPITNNLNDYNELVIGWGGTLDSGNTYTAIGAYGNATTLKVGTTLDLGMEDRQLGRVTDGQQSAFSITNSSNWTCGVTTFKTVASLPSTATSLVNPFNNWMYSDVGGDDGDYVIESGSEYIIAEYKKAWTSNTSNINATWKGRTTLAPSLSPVYLQIYNVTSGAWETLTSQTVIPADTDFVMQATQTTNLNNYYDGSNIVTIRVYQQVV